uniref:Uncharacterized protein n=1 Tax=Glossina pallidipes TaxID=7398 RepID=A0A1A9ZX79_GLOPL
MKGFILDKKICSHDTADYTIKMVFFSLMRCINHMSNDFRDKTAYELAAKLAEKYLAFQRQLRERNFLYYQDCVRLPKKWKRLNGNAAIQEKVNSEKKDAEELENDKDITTEKKVDSLAGGDSVDPPPAAETPKHDSSATGEEISPLSEENGKKNMKKKVKKKWSFRSVSFGKKDKQKPPKTDDDMPCANNGTEEKTVPNTKEPEESQEDHLSNATGVVNEQTTEQNENFHATNNTTYYKNKDLK